MFSESQARVLFSLQAIHASGDLRPGRWGCKARGTLTMELDLIDILRFMLAKILKAHHGNQELSVRELLVIQQTLSGKVELDGKSFHLAELTPTQKAEMLVAFSVVRRINMELFRSLAEDHEIPFRDLYGRYVGQAILGFFRADNGTLEGTYQADWDGNTDEEHLADILTHLDPDAPDFREQIYLQLNHRYATSATIE